MGSVAAPDMSAAWYRRLASAALEQRIASGLRRRMREVYAEQRLRAALGLMQAPWLRAPRIALRGDFESLPESRALKGAFHKAMQAVHGPPALVRDMDGMSGQKYRAWINALVRQHPDARYLEIGSWLGSTAVSAMYGNALEVLCIDNWSEFGGPKAQFFENIERARSPSVRFRFIESDYRQVDYTALGTFNIYLFDGPHSEQEQYDGIMLVRPALDKRVIIIVDDWNWPSVRIGTFRALRDAGFKIEAAIDITTTRGNVPPPALGKGTDWHNGYFLSVCTAP